MTDIGAELAVRAFDARRHGYVLFVRHGSIPAPDHWAFMMFCRQLNGCRCHWGAA